MNVRGAYGSGANSADSLCAKGSFLYFAASATFATVQQMRKAPPRNKQSLFRVGRGSTAVMNHLLFAQKSSLPARGSIVVRRGNERERKVDRKETFPCNFSSPGLRDAAGGGCQHIWHRHQEKDENAREIPTCFQLEQPVYVEYDPERVGDEEEDDDHEEDDGLASLLRLLRR